MHLKGKVAIVTGASKDNGVGFAVAKALATHGSNIVIHYNSNKESAEKNAETLRQLGVEAATVQADARSETFGKDIVEATLKAFPGKTIDIVVNNAGILAGQPSLRDFTLEDFDTMFYTNTRSALLLIQAAEPHLTSPGARIVNISSVAARMGSSFGNFYAASKAALHALTRGWAEELGPRGITVNVALLGPISTDMVLPEEHPLVQRFRADQHIKRNGTADEAAAAVVFLASPDSSFVTGQVINVDGGLLYA